MTGSVNGQVNMDQVEIATTGTESGLVRFHTYPGDSDSAVGGPISLVTVEGAVSGPVKLKASLKGKLVGSTKGTVALNGSVDLQVPSLGATRSPLAGMPTDADADHITAVATWCGLGQ